MVSNPLIDNFGKFKFTVRDGLSDKSCIVLNVESNITVGLIVLEGVVTVR